MTTNLMFIVDTLPIWVDAMLVVATASYTYVYAIRVMS